MSDEIEEIRERHTMYPPSRPSSSSRYSFIVAYQDIATLLAEVDRLRAENERLRNVNAMRRDKEFGR